MELKNTLSPTSTLSTNSTDGNFEKILTLGKHVKALTKLVKQLQQKVRTYEEKEFQFILDEAKATLNEGTRTSTTTAKSRHISFSTKEDEIVVIDTPPTSPVPIKKEKSTWTSTPMNAPSTPQRRKVINPYLKKKHKPYSHM